MLVIKYKFSHKQVMHTCHELNPKASEIN